MSIRNRIIGIVASGIIAATASFVASHEGFSLRAYKDPVGINTICYGSTVGVQMGDYKSKEECDVLLKEELTATMIEVDKAIKVDVPSNVLISMTSFTYNLGISAFKRSTMLKKLNDGDIDGACLELPRWVYAKGRKLPGLVKRRNEEMKLCLS